jgi:tetratricopeptide (TPR) repeat protein
MTSRYQVAHLTEIDELGSNTPEHPNRRMVRRFFDVQAFGVNAWLATNPGDRVIEEHDEVGPDAGRHEELYFVAAGGASFVLDGAEHDAPSGTFVFVRDPSLRRGAVASEPNTVVLAFGGRAGEPFSVSSWEELAPAVARFEAGDYPGAKAILARALERHPMGPGVLYNLACAESLLGERDAAVGHALQAIELDDRFREYARTDSDLDSIRDDPKFAASLGTVS